MLTEGMKARIRAKAMEIRAMVEGAGHRDDQEPAAMLAGSIISGDEMEILKCERGVLTAFIEQPAAAKARRPYMAMTTVGATGGQKVGHQMTAAERAEVKRSGLDPDEIQADMESVAAEKAALRAFGKDPGLIEATKGARGFSEWKQLKDAYLASKGAA